MNRREFLKTSGCFVVTASLGGIAGCGETTTTIPPGSYAFPQGVASGDPREGSVMLWTRVERVSGTGEPVAFKAQVATTDDFATIVAERDVMATLASDHTVRLLVEGLQPGTTYYYRFLAGADTSTVGRTRTAPRRDDDATVNFAWVSCQDYEAGFYGAYRRLLNDDLAAAAGNQIHFVAHVGDFIYETRGKGFQTALDDNFQPIVLTDAQGKPRRIDPFPNGGTNASGEQFAKTVEDYRHLYKQFLRDPDLLAARARWPFICIWDDHEFTNDCWQTQANDDDKMSYDEPAQTRRVAANQAWFEYQPANLTGAGGVTGVTNEARDFAPATVSDTAYAATQVDADNMVTEASNVAALGSMTIYRSFRFGKNVELVMTDLRAYRSDHPIPEELSFGNRFFFDPRNAVPLEMVNTLDAGRTANGGNPPDTVLSVFPNVRKASPAGTLLGAKQKQWFKASLKGSDAKWKIWASSVPITRLLMNASAGPLPFDLILSSDAWDGFATERKELMKFLTDNGITNVVAISGDIHAHAAGTILDDPDGANGKAVMTEFVAAGISSNTNFSFLEGPTRNFPQLRPLITYDATKLGGTEKFVRNMNTMLLWGVRAAAKAAETNDPAAALAERDPAVNPHLRYVDFDARGYGLMKATATGITTTLVTVPAPTKDVGTAGATIKGKATFTLTPQAAGQPVTLDPPVLEGAKPFPLT